MNNKRLYRSEQDKALGGVAAGLAQYFDLDVTLVRMLFVLLALADGVGILLYLAMWLIMPEESAEDWI